MWFNACFVVASMFFCGGLWVSVVALMFFLWQIAVSVVILWWLCVSGFECHLELNKSCCQIVHLQPADAMALDKQIKS